MSQPGLTVWLTGLSGAGKSTIGTLVRDRMAEERATVLLDGDELRWVYGEDGAHTEADRRRIAARNARLCKVLTGQGVDVVCATISMFEDCRAWNRANLPAYFEVYLRVPMELLIERDSKSVYAGGGPIVGLDVPFEEPKRPDLVIDNDGRWTVDEVTRQITDRIGTLR